jgi:proteasome component ECM29
MRMMWFQIKHGIVELLAADIYPKNEILVHLLVATADTRYSVATAADRELKRTVQ